MVMEKVVVVVEVVVIVEVVVVAEVVFVVEVVVMVEVLVVVKVKTKAMCHPRNSVYWCFDCDPPAPLCVLDCNKQRHTKSKF